MTKYLGGDHLRKAYFRSEFPGFSPLSLGFTIPRGSTLQQKCYWGPVAHLMVATKWKYTGKGMGTSGNIEPQEHIFSDLTSTRPHFMNIILLANITASWGQSL